MLIQNFKSCICTGDFFSFFEGHWKSYLEVSYCRIVLVIHSPVVWDSRNLPFRSGEYLVCQKMHRKLPTLHPLFKRSLCQVRLSGACRRLGLKPVCFTFPGIWVQNLTPGTERDTGWSVCVYTVWPDLSVCPVNLLSHVHQELCMSENCKIWSKFWDLRIWWNSWISLQIGGKHSWLPTVPSAQWDCVGWAVVSLGNMSFCWSGLCWITSRTPRVFILPARWIPVCSCCCLCIVILTL